MEASAIHAPARFARRSPTASLLRLRSDEQLVSLLRQGSQDAFRIIHDRYRQRLFAYVRQMLGAGSRQDAEDVLQDVFARAYMGLRGDQREINLRPWLYRVAHNRCIDHMRRVDPPTTELFETAGKPLHDPFEDVQRRDDLRRLVADIGRLPDQQRSALLMREINGLSYRDLAEALDVTVPAVKSLLVRARVELVETADARSADCADIRGELLESYDQGVKTSPRARRHLRECDACEEYRVALRGMRRSFAALSPIVVVGPLALIGKALGLGGTGGGAAGAGGSSGAGALGLGLTGATAAKVAVVVSTAAITAGGAVEIERRVHPQPAPASLTRVQSQERLAAAGFATATPGAQPTPWSNRLLAPSGNGGAGGAGPAPAGNQPGQRVSSAGDPQPVGLTTGDRLVGGGVPATGGDQQAISDTGSGTGSDTGSGSHSGPGPDGGSQAGPGSAGGVDLRPATPDFGSITAPGGVGMVIQTPSSDRPSGSANRPSGSGPSTSSGSSEAPVTMHTPPASIPRVVGPPAAPVVEPPVVHLPNPASGDKGDGGGGGRGPGGNGPPGLNKDPKPPKDPKPVKEASLPAQVELPDGSPDQHGQHGPKDPKPPQDPMLPASLLP